MSAEEEAMATTKLLIDRATEGLDAAKQADLAALLEGRPELDDDGFELAAAAIDLAYTTTEHSMPAVLRQRLSVQASEYFATNFPATTSAPAAVSERPKPQERQTLAEVKPFNAPQATQAPAAGPGRWLWGLAAAAVLTLAILGTWPRSAPALDPVQARASLIAEASDLLQLDWTATEDPAATGASGDVVWSNAAQEGYMRFQGLKVNDPAIEQYQLWIFDTQQDEKFPIDGGVFDVTTGEVIVPIDAKLSVIEPTLFAITVEKPGGVVVSSRERLPLLAQVG